MKSRSPVVPLMLASSDSLADLMTLTNVKASPPESVSGLGLRLSWRRYGVSLLISTSIPHPTATITRKIALFAGGHGGGRTWATIFTLLQTAKMDDVDPHAWLTQNSRTDRAGRPILQIDALMPWHFKA